MATYSNTTVPGVKVETTAGKYGTMYGPYLTWKELVELTFCLRWSFRANSTGEYVCFDRRIFNQQITALGYDEYDTFTLLDHLSHHIKSKHLSTYSSK